MTTKPETDVTFPTQRFLTPLLRGACDFLELKRREHAWGYFNNGPTELGYARLALTALKATYFEGSDKSVALQLHIAAVELDAKSAFCDCVDNLDLSAASDLLTILLIPRDPDHDLIARIKLRLYALIRQQLDRPQSIRVREFSGALLTLAQSHSNETQLLNDGVQALKHMENKDGGWPGGSAGEASIIATAAVIEALRAVDRSGLSEAIRRGELFLESRITDTGWQQLGGPDIVFSQANVLRVLAKTSSQEVIEPGLSALKAAANDDGWGAAFGHPSTIEMTALALLALAACDENSFVPYRVAAGRFSEIEDRNRTLDAELNKLKESIDRQIARDSGSILADRDKWRNEAKDQARRLTNLEQELRDAQREAYDQFRKSQELINEMSRNTAYFDIDKQSSFLRMSRAMETVIAAMLAVIGISIFFSTPQTIVSLLKFDFSAQFVGSILFFAAASIVWRRSDAAQRLAPYGVLLTAAILSLLMFTSSTVSRLNVLGIDISAQMVMALAAELALLPVFVDILSRIRIRRRLELKYAIRDTPQSGRISIALREYADIESEMPSAVREEFYYALSNRIIDMPKDVGMRYTEEFVDRQKIPRRLKPQILSWVLTFLEFEPHSRRALVEQIRRQSMAQ